MQITANQTLLPLTTQLNRTANNNVTTDNAAEQKREEIVKVDLPETTVTALASPATQVSFSGPKEASDLYEQPKLTDTVQMKYSQDKGEAATHASQTLATDATNLRKSRSPFSPSSLLSQIGSLSRETNSYNNIAHSFQTTSTNATDKSKPDLLGAIGKPQQTVTLRVRTKDGDTIDIKIQHSQSQADTSLEFSFEVNGKLSEAEQDALEKLANKLGQVADDFFRTGTTQLHGLNEFDQTNLKDFRIEFSKRKENDTYATLSYDFSIDEATQTQHLSAKDVDGYSLDITANLRDLLSDASTSRNKSLENYLSIIRKTLNDYDPLQQEHSNAASMRFIVDGFTSMLGSGEKSRETADSSPIESALNAFDTGLPDFNAVINAPLTIYRNPKHKLILPESMSLKLEQKTEAQMQTDGNLIVKQVNSFERQSRQIEGIIGSDKGDMETGNFNYKTLHEKQELSRTLSIGKDEINNLTTEFTSSKDTTIQEYMGFNVKDIQKEEHNEYKITQMIDEINKHKSLKQELDRINYIENSHKNLFI